MRLSQDGRGFDATIGDVNRQLCGLVLLAALAASGCADSTAVTAPTTVALASIVLSSTTVSGGTPVTADFASVSRGIHDAYAHHVVGF